jgi:hypothetical protein
MPTIEDKERKKHTQIIIIENAKLVQKQAKQNSFNSKAYFMRKVDEL